MFYVGQKVVCVNAVEKDFRKPGVQYRNGVWLLQEKEIYTIRELLHNSHGSPTMKLVELADRSVDGDKGYNRKRFRPLVEKKTDISIFTSMLNKSVKELKQDLLETA